MYIDYFAEALDCCGTLPVSPTDDKWVQSFELMKDQIIEIYNKAVAEMIFVEKEQKYLGILEDLQNLFFYFNMIEDKRQLDITQGNAYSDAYYYEEYNMKRMIRYFTCKGLDIAPVISIWNFDNDSGLYSGIGSMSIEGDEQPFVTK